MDLNKPDSKKYIFTAPGRTEICGNHTDHQHGRVMAAAVNLETTAEVTLNGDNIIRIISEGYEHVVIELGDYEFRKSEINSTDALVRGVLADFAERGADIKGFDARIHSTVLPGSGLSSSAAFEVLIGRIVNGLFYNDKCTPVEIAQIGMRAENEYFGKPCGLMDQLASASDSMVYIDFNNPASPEIEKIDFDFASHGYALCIIDTKSDHADLTDEFSAIPAEMKAVAKFFGKDVLRDVDEAEFYGRIQETRTAVGDRAVLRAIHFFNENRRVKLQADALKADDMDTFLSYVRESANSSWELLQNITPTGLIENQNVAVILAIAARLLNGKGAVRIHGGGFGGTIQAYVPVEELDEFKNGIEAVTGEGSCHLLHI